MKRRIIGAAASLLIALVILLLPTPKGLDPAGHKALAVIVLAVGFWATDVLASGITAVGALGLLLAALVPTSGMTISWTGFAKGNLEAAVKMTVVGLILGSLATPFYVQWLLGAHVSVDTPAVMKQIAFIVFLPMLAGYATQQWLMKRYTPKVFQDIWAPRFPGLSTIGVLGIVFIAIALKARAILVAPEVLVGIAIPLALLYAIIYLLSTFTGKLFLNRGDAIALVYGTVMRNLSIALAVAMNAFGTPGSDAALVIALAYIIQVQSAAWYVKIADKIFGAATN